MKSQIVCFQDQEEISEDIYSEFNLKDYCVKTDNTIKVNFVGFIIYENIILASFPKNYEQSNKDSIEKNLDNLKRLFIDLTNTKGIFEKIDENNNFPIKAYSHICNHYIKYGLYSETERNISKGYKGSINWKKTLLSSSKIISDNNLLYFPFYINENKENEVFITDCMSFVLQDGFMSFGQFFNFGIKYKSDIDISKFRNINFIINKLIKINNKHFKDYIKILLKNLIEYFKWKSSFNDKIYLATRNFNLVWQHLIEIYLNKNLLTVLKEKEYIYDNKKDKTYKINKPHEMKFKKNCNSFNFISKEISLESFNIIKYGNTRRFRVEYDHYFSKENFVYLFDSKYYSTIDLADYKQMVYFYIIRNKKENYHKNLFNGLIMPTCKKYHSKIHVDRTDIENNGLFITEHYFNIKDVIEDYLFMLES